MTKHPVFLAVARIVALALASGLAGCSINPPKPSRCDGSDRRAINSSNPTLASLPTSKSCSALPGALGSRDTG